MLELHELQRLLLDPSHPPRDRAILYFLADTGARLGEAVSLEWRDLGNANGSVVLRGKTGERLVPVSHATLDMLRALPQADARVFTGRVGPLTVSGMGHLISKAFRRAGFTGPRYSAHSLRHTFGQLWDGDETVLQQIFGHTSVKMVQRYRAFRLSRARAQHALYSPLARLAEAQGRELTASVQ